MAVERYWITRVTAFVCITILGTVAMIQNIDGIWIPLAATAAISGIAGYELGWLFGDRE